MRRNQAAAVHPASCEEHAQTSEKAPHNRADEVEAFEFADTLNFLIIRLHLAFIYRGQLGSGAPTGVTLARSPELAPDAFHPNAPLTKDKRET